MPPSLPIMVSYSNDYTEDENPPLPTQILLDDSIKHELAPASQLPKWVHSTHVVVSDLVSDPIDQRHIFSQFHQASSIFSQVSKTCALETFTKASIHPDW